LLFGISRSVTGMPGEHGREVRGRRAGQRVPPAADGAREVRQPCDAAFVRVAEGRHVHAIGAHVERPRGEIAQRDEGDASGRIHLNPSVLPVQP
jgi:hypothetical protein